ncbi:Protein O-mannosyltransferase 2 [Chytriomyces hyalinus]|nr:Protein O-mannosyltransferase 2 [Chytriomyces hyalinus]
MFKVGIVGWIINFIPYILMPRVTYIHHYLPAIQFGIILFAFILDHLLDRMIAYSPRQMQKMQLLKRTVFWALIVVDLAMFYYFKDFAFGAERLSDYKSRQWMAAWKI